MGKSKRKKSSGVDYTSRVVSIFSIVIAVLSLVFSYWTYQQNQKEILRVNLLGISNISSVELFPPPSDSSASDSIRLGPIPRHYEVGYWKCVISNIGNRPLSIIRYNVWRKDGENKLYRGGSNTDFGIFNEELEKQNLPFTLGVGESVELYFRIGIPSVLVSFPGYHNKFKFGNSYSLLELSNYIMNMKWKMSQSETDSNKNTIIDHGDGTFTVKGKEVDTSPHGKFIKVELYTSKGETFTDTETYSHIYRDYHPSRERFMY